MDWLNAKGKGIQILKKYRYVLAVLLAGIFLMTLPSGKQDTPAQQTPLPTESETNLQEALEEILSKVSGAGKVKVLLTEAAGAQTLYQTDDTTSREESSQDTRRSTVLIRQSTGTETGLIRQIRPPVYQGAVIVCQGGDRATVKLAIVEAVSNATGLTADKISVLKMK